MSLAPTSLEGWTLACRTLESLGIHHVFGLPGTQTVPLYEAIRRSGLTSVVPTSELAAAFMAGAYYRASGRVAALATIPGPGFTYALTGLAEARLDSAALIHVTIAAPEGPGARFRLQAIPQQTIGRALAKATLVVERLEDVEPALRAAYRLSLAGEPGPVIVSFAETAGTCSWQPEGLAPADECAAAPDLGAAWRRLADAHRPLIYAGQGALGSADRLRRLAEDLGAPVMTTPSARGLLPETHRLCLPFDPCRGGLEAARQMMDQADLVLVLGAKLGHNGAAGHSLPFHAGRTLQLDADPDTCGQASAVPRVVTRIEDWLEARPAGVIPGTRWTPSEIESIRTRLRHPAAPAAEPRIAGRSAAEFFARLRGLLPTEAMLVTDTGLHQVLMRRHYDVLTLRGLLMPSDFQSMGFGLPAAIAAKLACPQRPTVALVGDGSLAMSGLELTTAAKLGLPLPVIVFADGFLNQIRLQQQSEFGQDSGVALPALDLEAFAAAVGADYATADQLTETLPAALSAARPTLIEVPVGDSPALRRIRRARAIKEIARRTLGERVTGALRRRLP